MFRSVYPQWVAQTSFCPALQSVYAEKRIKGSDGEYHSIKAISSPEDCLILREIMLNRKPKRTLEVGMARGESTAAICQSHKDLGRAPEAQHIAIDPFEYEVWKGTGVTLLKEAELEQYFELSEEPSYQKIPKLIERGDKFEMIYIDGSHFFEYVFTDAFLADKILSVGGIMILDDTDREHVKKVARFFLNNFPEAYSEIDPDIYRKNLPFNWKHLVKKAIRRKDLMILEKKREMDRTIGDPLRAF